MALIIFYPKKVDILSDCDCSSEYFIQTNETKYITIPSYEDIEKSVFMRMIRNIFSTPFNLKYYDVYIKDRSNYENDPSGIKWIYSLEEEVKEMRPYEEVVFHSILVNKKQIFQSNVTLEKPFFPIPSVSFTVSYDIWVRPNLWDFMTKIFLFMVAYWGIFLIFINVNDYIKKK